MITVLDWQQPDGCPNPLAVPMRGGMLILDTKRAPNETQYVDFMIDARSFWAVYPNDHVYVVLDGTVDGWNGGGGYTGRGAVIERNRVTFERFNDASLYEPTSVNMQDLYRFVVHASSTHVAWFLFAADGVTLLTYKAIAMADPTPNAAVSQIILGATSDFNPPGTPKVPALVGISGVKMARFTA